MDTLTLAGIIIAFLCGYTVFKDLLHNSEINHLRKQLSSKDAELIDPKSLITSPMDPADKHTEMADGDPGSVPLDEVPNPFVAAVPRVPIT